MWSSRIELLDVRSEGSCTLPGVGVEKLVGEGSGQVAIGPRLPRSAWMLVGAAAIALIVGVTAIGLLLGSGRFGLPDLYASQEQSPDGPVLVPIEQADLFAEQNVVVLDPADRQESGAPAAMTSVAFSPDGSMVAAGGTTDGVVVWDMSSGEQLVRLSGPTARIDDVAWSPDGERVAAGGEDGRLYIWRLFAGTDTLEILEHGDEVTSIVWSPDSEMLATGSDTGRVRTWEPDSPQHVAQLQNPASVRELAWPDDGGGIAVGHEGGLRTWDPATNSVSEDLDYSETLVDVSWSPDWRRQVVSGQDSYMNLYSGGIALLGRAIRAHSGDIVALAWSPDGRIIASGANDNTVVLWRASDRKVLARFDGHAGQVIDLAWSADSTRLAVSGTGSSISVRQLATEVLEEAAK